MKMLRFLTLTIAAVLTFSVVAEAATCVASDLRGKTWYTYVSWTGGWTRCTIQVLSTGAIASRTGGCRGYDEATRTFGTVNIISGGSLAVRTTDCLVTGVVKTSDGTHTIVEARLDPGKTVLTGAGKDGNGDAWTFSAVRN